MTKTVRKWEFAFKISICGPDACVACFVRSSAIRGSFTSVLYCFIRLSSVSCTEVCAVVKLVKGKSQIKTR